MTRAQRVAIALTLAASALVAAQERPIFRSETHYIEVDAVVTDRDGRFVPGLTAADFRIRERGRTEPVGTFAYIDLSTQTSTAAPARPVLFRPSTLTSDQVDFDRLYLIYLSPVATEYLSRARLMAKRFVTDYLTDRDVAAVWNGEFERPLAFTNDKTALIRSIEPFMGTSIGGGRDRNVSLGGLRAAIDWMTGIQGRRKSLVLFSSGLLEGPISGMPGDTGDLRGSLMQLSSLSSSFRHNTPEFTMADLVGRSDVHVYACDVRGLAPAPVSSQTTNLSGAALADQVGNQYSQLSASIANLKAVADVTGGLALINRNDYERGFQLIADDNSRYYLLGYMSHSTLPRGYFVPIDVSVVRPGLRVRARQGYVTR